jgi:hypothetical protein
MSTSGFKAYYCRNQNIDKALNTSANEALSLSFSLSFSQRPKKRASHHHHHHKRVGDLEK